MTVVASPRRPPSRACRRRIGPPVAPTTIAAQLGHAVACHEEAFADKSRFSMDWYYPVLGGPVRGAAAQARLADRWDEFVVPSVGCRCVADRPWVTGAETAELVHTLAAVGDTTGDSRLDLTLGPTDTGWFLICSNFN